MVSFVSNAYAASVVYMSGWKWEFLNTPAAYLTVAEIDRVLSEKTTQFKCCTRGGFGARMTSMKRTRIFIKLENRKC